MEKFVTDFVVDYFKNNTSKRKNIKNQELDLLLQTELGLKPIGEAGIRALIHDIRKNESIENEKDGKGWICGSSDGYYLSFNPLDILTHLIQYEGKINKMKLIHQRGMSILKDKIFYKQSEIDFNN